jgi:hypothetical protein|nr:MAG TPA: hypothetical protein [Caudoviricetes sp.]
MNGVSIPVWYSKPGSDKRVKALLLDTYDGYATIALESGRFVIDHIEYLTLDDAAGVFEQHEWMDGEDE